MTQEQFEDLKEKAKEYIYKVMFDGEFSREKYDEEFKKVQEAEVKPYTDFNEVDLNINMEHLVQGYASFGRPFLIAAMSQDLDSAANMFECAVQQVLDLTSTIQDFERSLVERINAAKAQENSEEIHISTTEGE